MTNTPSEGQEPEEPFHESGTWDDSASGPSDEPTSAFQSARGVFGQAEPQAPFGYAPDHPQATTALVLGILGLVLCQVIAPFAWVMGKRAVDEIDASQGRLGGRGPAQAGYVLGIVGTALLAVGVVFFLFLFLVAGIGILTTQ